MSKTDDLFRVSCPLNTNTLGFSKAPATMVVLSKIKAYTNRCSFYKPCKLKEQSWAPSILSARDCVNWAARIQTQILLVACSDLQHWYNAIHSWTSLSLFCHRFAVIWLWKIRNKVCSVFVQYWTQLLSFKNRTNSYLPSNPLGNQWRNWEVSTCRVISTLHTIYTNCAFLKLKFVWNERPSWLSLWSRSK